MSVLLRAIMAALAVLCACEPEPCADLFVDPSDLADDATWAEPRLRCDTHPELCALPVWSDVAEPEAARAYDIVFVGEGYDADQMEGYRARVRRLIASLREDPTGFVRVDPGAFNFYRVDVVSGGNALDDADRGDTALGGCYEHRDGSFLPTTERSRTLTAAANVPWADVVVVLFDDDFARARAHTDGFIVWLGGEDGAGVLTHELGHALFDLADEYTEHDGCLTTASWAYQTLDPLFDVPNLTTDPRGARWRDLVHGAKRGGRKYGDCVYHPTDNCRMLDSDTGHFCPVCDAHIRTSIAIRRDPGANDGTPRCGLVMSQDPEQVTGEPLMVGWMGYDLNGIPDADLSIDGAHVASFACAAPCTGTTLATLVEGPFVTPGIHDVHLRCCDALGLCGDVERYYVVRAATDP